MFKVDPKQVRRESLLPYLKNHYEELTKKQIYEITTEYIKLSYLNNGNHHVNLTNEMLKKYDKGD